jgi:hypothetical protein
MTINVSDNYPNYLIKEIMTIMKKNLTYLAAALLLAATSVFTSCSNNDQPDPTPPLPPPPVVPDMVFNMADYAAMDTPYAIGNTEFTNFPTNGALFCEWNSPTSFTGETMAALLRHLGGAILPQVLKSITLKGDGNVIAEYIDKPTINIDPMTIMTAMFGTYPAAADVTSHFPTTGFTTAPEGMAVWTEAGGNFGLKLNIVYILGSLGEEASTIAPILTQVLNGTPAEVKTMLAALYPDAANISDATIAQLLSWVKDGIPMKMETLENGHTVIYLNKSAFDNLFTLRTVDGNETNDLMIIWNMLSSMNIIPAEAAMAGLLLTNFGDTWGATTDFKLGLELVKQ